MIKSHLLNIFLSVFVILIPTIIFKDKHTIFFLFHREKKIRRKKENPKLIYLFIFWAVRAIYMPITTNQEDINVEK